MPFLHGLKKKIIMGKGHLCFVIFCALGLSSAWSEYIPGKAFSESEYLSDLIIEIDLYLALPTFGAEIISFYHTPNSSLDKSLCEDPILKFKSQRKTIYARLESNQKSPVSLLNCKSPNNSLEILLVRPDYAKHLSKVQLAEGINKYFSSGQDQGLALSTKIVRNKALLREGYHVEEDYTKVQEGQVDEFKLFKDLFGVLRAVNYFYLVADWKLFWLMAEEIGEIEKEGSLSVQEAYLLITASENLVDVYLARLWAGARLPLNRNCNHDCSICSDDLIICKQCKTGYFLKEAKCVKCKSLCESCINEETCSICGKNAYYQTQLNSCTCLPMFKISSFSGDCQLCEDINCGENPKPSSRNLKYSDEIKEYTENCALYGTNNTILSLLKSRKVTGDLLGIVIKDFENYVNAEVSNDQLLDNTISIINEFLNKLQTQALEQNYTMVYANALRKVMKGLNRISRERSNGVMQIAEKILEIGSVQLKTDASVLIIKGLLELYKEVGYVTRLNTEHIIVVKTENLEKNLNRLKKLLQENIRLDYRIGNFNKTQLITFQAIIIDKPLREIHINIFSDKSYINKEIFLENRTDIELKVSASIKLAGIYNLTTKCTGRNTENQEISCELLKLDGDFYLNFTQSGIYSFAKNQKEKTETKSFSFALGLLIFWVTSNLFSMAFGKISKLLKVEKINERRFAGFNDDKDINVGGNPVMHDPDKLIRVNSESVLEYHLLFGFFMNPEFFNKIERISIYIPTLTLELLIQIYLNQRFSLNPLAQSIFSVIFAIPFTIALAYFLLIKDKKIMTKVFTLLILASATRIIYSLDPSENWLTSFILGVLIDFLVNQTVLLLFIKKLRS